MVPVALMHAVASLTTALVDGGITAPQNLLVVELDGRRWVLHPNPDGSGGWIIALSTPRGEPEPGSELLLPLMSGEVFPWAWWCRFCEATDPLPVPAPGAAVPFPRPGAHEPGQRLRPADLRRLIGDRGRRPTVPTPSAGHRHRPTP